MVYYSRRQCSNPDDCAETPSPTVERVLHTMAPSFAPDDHKILRAYVVLAANLILFLALARAGYRALTRPRAAPPAARGHHRRNSSLTMEKMMDGIDEALNRPDATVRRRSVTKPECAWWAKLIGPVNERSSSQRSPLESIG